MNEIQKEDHPEAYEPEIVRVYNKKKEDEQRIKDFHFYQEKTLFDFDEDLDKLSDIEDRYMPLPVQNTVQNTANVGQIDSIEVKDNQQSLLIPERSKDKKFIDHEECLKLAKKQMIRDLSTRKRNNE